MIDIKEGKMKRYLRKEEMNPLLQKKELGKEKDKNLLQNPYKDPLQANLLNHQILMITPRKIINNKQ